MEHWYTMGKKHVSVPKTTYEILTDNEKKHYGTMLKQWQFLNTYLAIKLWFTMEKTKVLHPKLWCHTENYGPLIYYEKTMV